MKLLLDTCVISELRHPKGDFRVRAFLEQFEESDLFLSVLTLGEIAKGIGLLAEGDRKLSLSLWMAGLEDQFMDRIVDVDRASAILWGCLTSSLVNRGLTLPAVDGLLAATAIRHGFTVVTRNVRHFEMAGATTVNPWAR